MANNRELSQFGSLVEVSNEATSIKVGLAGASVGIGTTNPTERLEVHGNIKIVDGSINVASASSFTEQTTFEAGVGIADSIFHIGDVDTQIRFPSADTFSVKTGGTERLNISNSGLGIEDTIYHLGDTNTKVRFPTADTFTLETGGAERFRIGSNGYASIGKGTQGDELLHVGSSSTISPAIKVENDQGSLIIGRRQTSRFGIGTEGHVIQSDGDDFAIGTSDGEDFTIGTNNEKRITVKSAGKVGIGTDDPDELLEVLGKAKVVDLVASNISVASGVGTFQTLKVSGDLTVEGTTTTLDTNLIGVDRVEVGANSDSIVGVAVTQSGKADILKLFNGAGTEVLGITTDGNITIQNTDAGSSAAPELSLYRNSASPANADYLGQIKFQGENNAGAKVNYAKITGKILDVNGTGDSEDGILEFAFQKGGSNNISARFRSDSLQLINGTTLTVAGNITANGNIQGDGDTNITSINDITAGGVLTVDGVSDLDELTVTGVSTFSANVNLGDNDKLQIGNGTDLRLYHNATHSYIENYTGNLYIFNASNDKDVLLQTDDGSGGTTNYVVCDGSEGSVILNHYGSTKFETTGLGATVTGNLGVRTDLTVGNVLTVDGVSDLDELVVAGVSTLTTLRMSINNAVGITSIVDEDDMASNSDTALATQQSIKAYVATQISAEDLDVTTDSGTIAIDLDSETLSISGTSNEIETSATGNAVTIGLPNNVTIGGELDVTTLDVSGNADIDGLTNLDEVIVAGVSTFSSDLSIADKIVHTGDTNTAIRFPAADTFTVETAGAEKLRVTSAGHVGIGTDNPAVIAGMSKYLTLSSKTVDHAVSFELQGNRTGSDQTVGRISFINNTNEIARINVDSSSGGTNGNLTFATSGTEKLRLTNTGLVGIGTIAPFNNTSDVDIRGGSSALSDGGQIVTIGVNTKKDNTPQLAFGVSDADGYGWIRSYASGVGGKDLVFASISENLRIKSAGEVGIGTDNPAEILHLHGATTKSLLRFTSGTYGVSSSDGSHIGINFGGLELWHKENNYLRVGTNNTERLRITSSGKILSGIATARDNLANNASGVEAQVQIEGSSFTSSTLSIIRNSNDANDGGIILGKTRSPNTYGNAAVQAGDDLGDLIFAGSDGTSLQFGAEILAEVQSGVGNDDLPTDLIFKTNGGTTDTTERVRITSGGDVGINSESPKVKLDIRSTDAIRVPVGTTGERPTGAAGYIRYNSSIASYEGHNGSEWAGIGGAAEVETSVSSTSATTCESFAKATYRSASIIAQITQGSSYQVGNYLLIHDGTTVTVVEESAVATGDMLGSFTASISGSNVVFQVNMASASSATVTTKMTKVSIP